MHSFKVRFKKSSLWLFKIKTDIQIAIYFPLKTYFEPFLSVLKTFLGRVPAKFFLLFFIQKIILPFV
jgi:hypothetical protein